MRILMDLPLHSNNATDLHLQLVDGRPDNKVGPAFLLKLGKEQGHEIDPQTAASIIKMSRELAVKP